MNSNLILGSGVSGPVIMENGLALKKIKIDDVDIKHENDLSNYKNISFTESGPPRNCDLKMEKYYKDNEPFIPGINPWREIYILKKLINIKGLVQYVKHDIYGDNIGLYTKIAGVTLYDWMFQEHSDQEWSLIINQGLQIIKKMNEIGIIHSDIKPQNCVIDKDLNLTIIDFGWAFCKEFPMSREEEKYFNQSIKDNIDIKNFLLYFSKEHMLNSGMKLYSRKIEIILWNYSDEFFPYLST